MRLPVFLCTRSAPLRTFKERRTPATTTGSGRSVCIFCGAACRYVYPACYSFTASLSFLPGLNLGVCVAGRSVVSPVCGFRPLLADLSTDSKVPNPTIFTLHPAASSSATMSVKTSKNSSVSFFPAAVLAAIALTSSVLFIFLTLSLFFCRRPRRYNAGTVFCLLPLTYICILFFLFYLLFYSIADQPVLFLFFTGLRRSTGR